MKHHKAQVSMIIIGAVGLVLLITIIMVGVFIANKSSIFSNTEEEVELQMELFLKGEDANKNSFDGEYIIKQDSKNLNGFIKSKLKKDAFIPVKLHAQDDIDVYCWSENHYITHTEKKFSLREKNLNQSKLICDMEKIGVLDIKLIKANLNNDKGDIILNITAEDGSFNKIGLCISWTAGFIDVYLKEHRLICPYGMWKNYTFYDAVNDEYDFLPEQKYLCGKDWFEECKETDSNRCNPKDIDVPTRFFGQVDECFYYGKTLKEGQSERIVLKFESLDMKNQLDNIEVTFFDHDLMFVSHLDDFISISEDNEGDLGSEDISYRLDYNG